MSMGRWQITFRLRNSDCGLQSPAHRSLCPGGKVKIITEEVSFSIRPAVFLAGGWADPPPAEHPKPETIGLLLTPTPCTL